MTTEQEKQFENILKDRVDHLIELAKMWGFVVTIETVPKQPLAMRNYEMVGDVRKAR